MIIIDGKNAVMGRLASFVAKESLKGEEIVIVNCEKILITGNKKDILENFEEKRGRVGSGQKGPKYPRKSEMIVKRVIRGMVPNFRTGRGKDAYRRVKCYVGIPEEFKDKKKIVSGKEKTGRFVYVEEINTK